MSNAVTHNTGVRNTLADAICNPSTGAIGSGAKIVIYSGTMPANAAASLSGNTAIATITGLAFGSPPTGGVSTVASSTADTNAVGGTASFFRILNASNTVIIQGTVGTSGCDLNLNSVTIATSATVTLTSGTYTAPL